MAYVSDEAGRFETYVTPFPEGGSKSQVSIDGGTQPRWSKDGKELFYVEDDTLMAVSVSTTSSFSVGTTTKLFSAPTLRTSRTGAQYDVSADGLRFVVVETLGSEQTKELSIHIVQNWYEDFRDREQD